MDAKIEKYSKTISRPTWAEVDLYSILENINMLKGKLSPEIKFMAVVKANAYGHGMLEVSRAISRKVDFLGIATVDEGIHLRANNINNPLLIMSAILPEESKQVVLHDLTPTVFTEQVASCLNKEAKNQGKILPIHVKVDTGMGRIGVWYKKAIDFFRLLKNFSNIEVQGVYTHFPSAEEDDEFTFLQIGRFNKIMNILNDMGIHIPYRHASNSAAIVKFKKAHFNLVRPGLMIYGVYPHPELKKFIELTPSFSLKSKLTYLKKIKPGRSVSYNRTFIAKEDTLIGTIPVGYADGYPFNLSNKGKVIINNKFAPVVGRVCMDQFMVNLNNLPEVRIGDEVILIGRQNDREISVEELARLADTIPYELLCGMGERVPKIYYGNG